MDGQLHALAANPRIEFGDETKAAIEEWVYRIEQASQEMRNAAETMMSAAESHNRAVTRNRTGD